MRTILAATLLIFALSGCRSKSDYYRIPRAEIATLERAALSGDTKSARRLVHHWLIANNDIEQGKKWLLKAAEFGDLEACKDLTGLGVATLPSSCSK